MLSCVAGGGEALRATPVGPLALAFAASLLSFFFSESFSLQKILLSNRDPYPLFQGPRET